MSYSHLTRWIEDAEEREIRQRALFSLGSSESQYLHLGSTIARISDWWHHNVTRDVLPVHYEPPTCH